MKKAIAGTILGVMTLGGGSVAIDNQINPYQSETLMQKGVPVQVLSDVASSTIQEAGVNKFIADTNQPRIELQKFNGELKMGVTYQGLAPNTTGSRPFLSKNVEWSDGNQTMQVVPLMASSTMEDGGYEINILLNNKPASNVFNFSIDGWQDLDFFYQAPLWQEAGLKQSQADCTDTDCSLGSGGAKHRPDNVVGSYAVYYKNHRDHIEGQTNYATGKVYHIFRPKITDAIGNEIWGDLSYANGVLSLTVDQSFLDGAIYPVTVDPTFGYTTAGASHGTAANNDVYGSGLNPATGVNGTVVDVNYNSANTSGNFKGLTILSAGTLVTNGVSPAKSVSTGWNVSTYSTSPSLTSGNTYNPAVIVDSASQPSLDTGGASGDGFGQFSSGNSYASPHDVTKTNLTNKYSIYATYTASGGGTTIVPTVQINAPVYINAQTKI